MGKKAKAELQPEDDTVTQIENEAAQERLAKNQARQAARLKAEAARRKTDRKAHKRAAKARKKAKRKELKRIRTMAGHPAGRGLSRVEDTFTWSRPLSREAMRTHEIRIPPMRLSQLLDQTEYWQPNDQASPVRLKSLAHSHKVNLIGWLERNATVIQNRISWDFAMAIGDDPSDGVFSSFMAETSRDPLEWMRDQELYQAIVRQVIAELPAEALTKGLRFVGSPDPRGL